MPRALEKMNVFPTTTWRVLRLVSTILYIYSWNDWSWQYLQCLNFSFWITQTFAYFLDVRKNFLRKNLLNIFPWTTWINKCHTALGHNRWQKWQTISNSPFVLVWINTVNCKTWSVINTKAHGVTLIFSSLK